jgi:hypothetical protein
VSGKFDDLPEIPAFLRRHQAAEECLLCGKECLGGWDDCPVRKVKEANDRSEKH